MTQNLVEDQPWEMASVTPPILGIAVTPITASELVTVLHTDPGQVSLVLNHNLHSAYLHRKHSWFRTLYAKADIIAIDGWPILKLAGAGKRVRLNSLQRIGSTDWLEVLQDASPQQTPLRVFVFGGTPESNEKAVARLSSGRAKLDVLGQHGYVAPADWHTVVDQIEEFQPRLVLLGMGMPLQEQFLHEHAATLPNAYYATVGGAIDYVAGVQKLSPRIFGTLGLEWLWRLANDPRRLFQRYCVEPFLLLALVARDSVRGGKA